MSGLQGGASQWIRAVSLIVSKGGSGLDLSEMRLRFEIRQTDVITPNTAYIRVYNLSDATSKSIRDEFTRVVLQAGYREGELQQVFAGTIVRVDRGHESNTDSYVDIYAVDGDIASNFGNLNGTLEAGATPKDQLDRVVKAMQSEDPDFDPTAPSNLAYTGGVLPRGKVLYGLGPEHLRRLGMTTGTRFSIQDGKLVAVPVNGYLASEAVVLSGQTGLIGWPIITQDGLMVTCLLNPRIAIGNRVQIDNKAINGVTNKSAPLRNVLNPFGGAFANESADGIYRVLVVEHTGDTRGNTWYSHLVCLALDPSSRPSSAAKTYG
jgi:hypothetical protein